MNNVHLMDVCAEGDNDVNFTCIKKLCSMH